MEVSSPTRYAIPTDAPSYTPSYAESFLLPANVNDLIPPHVEREDQDPPPDYDITFADAYSQWVATERASKDVSVLKFTLRQTEADLVKEQKVLAELKEKRSVRLC
jgi:hypothetical protein